MSCDGFYEFSCAFEGANSPNDRLWEQFKKFYDSIGDAAVDAIATFPFFTNVNETMVPWDGKQASEAAVASSNFSL